MLFYVYDDSQLLPDGTAPDTSYSQLYVIDALLIGLVPVEDAVICKIDMPARIPFGLHSDFLTEMDIDSQARSGNLNAQIIKESVEAVTADDGTVAKPIIDDEAFRFANANESVDHASRKNASLQTQATLVLWFTTLFWSLLGRIGVPRLLKGSSSIPRADPRSVPSVHTRST